MNLLCGQTGYSNLLPRHRAAWTQFCLSLMSRMPEDINAERRAIEISTQKPPEELRKSIENIDSIKSKDHSLTAEEVFALLEETDLETVLFNAFMAAHSGVKGASWFSGLNWCVIDFSDESIALLTSDRPFVKFFSSNSQYSTWALPISPSHLFVATPIQKSIFQSNEQWELEVIKKLSQSKQRLLKTINKCVVQQAIRYVYSSDDSELSFVSKHFGKKREDSRPAQMMLASIVVNK